MINIAICEDEEIIQKQLANTISYYFGKKKIEAKISVFSNGKNFLESCKKEIYSCVFMDIDLGDENGVEIVSQIRAANFTPMNVIFVTSFIEYRDQVLSLHTFDFIVKPFKNIQIEKVLDDLSLWINSDVKEPVKRLTLKTIEGTISLSLDEILYLEYVNRRIEIITFTTTYHMYGKMKDIYEYIKHDDFANPHVSFIVNLREIKKYYKSRNLIEMTNGKEMPISQLKVQNFRTLYNTFLSKCHKEMVHK